MRTKSATTGDYPIFTREQIYDEEYCDCDICPCCGKRKRKSYNPPYIITC